MLFIYVFCLLFLPCYIPPTTFTLNHINTHSRNSIVQNSLSNLMTKNKIFLVFFKQLYEFQTNEEVFELLSLYVWNI